ncbi:hypothetical protein [Flammeovirga sp. SubArs3]|uniref:hypothetical protein n=1 Tax=Flammeovirga sp. SubArs3 TaxID=2995316 RepID=UPI00248C49C8|nr:hypothetical protein [Flammeovirga sp. SubArs3]
MNSKINKTYQSNPFGDRVIYSSEKGEIALDYPCYLQHSKYELRNIKGDVIQKNEAFTSIEKAEVRIERLLS